MGRRSVRLHRALLSSDWWTIRVTFLLRDLWEQNTSLGCIFNPTDRKENGPLARLFHASFKDVDFKLKFALFKHLRPKSVLSQKTKVHSPESQAVTRWVLTTEACPPLRGWWVFSPTISINQWGWVQLFFVAHLSHGLCIFLDIWKSVWRMCSVFDLSWNLNDLMILNICCFHIFVSLIFYSMPLTTQSSTIEYRKYWKIL